MAISSCCCCFRIFLRNKSSEERTEGPSHRFANQIKLGKSRGHLNLDQVLPKMRWAKPAGGGALSGHLIPLFTLAL